MTGVIVMLLVILPEVDFPVEGCRGDRITVPVGVSLLLSEPRLSVDAGPLQASEGLLNCGPKWMWILLSSVVMMLLLLLYFLRGADPGCLSGVTLITVRPAVL